MKKIAIQYSGEIRNLLDCFNNHYENLILPNKEYDVDIFAHFWMNNEEKDSKIYRIINTIKPKDICFQQHIDFHRPDVVQDPRFPWYTPNMVSQFYGIERVNDMRLDYEKRNNVVYDYVIRIRSDIFFMPNCVSPIDHYEKGFLHIKDYSPYADQGLPYAINDYFAIGSPEIINQYGKVYSNLDSMIANGAAVNPELLIGYNVKDLPNKRHDFRMWPYKYMLMHLADIRNGNVG